MTDQPLSDLDRKLEWRRHASEIRKGKKVHKNGSGFQQGNIPWNKRTTPRVKRKAVRINGKKIEMNQYVYMTYHKLKEIPKGFVIHHIDENPSNDDISNLRIMRKEDHNFLHQMLDKERYKTKLAVLKLKEKCKELINLHQEFIRKVGVDNIESDFDKGAFSGVARIEEEIKEIFGSLAEETENG